MERIKCPKCSGGMIINEYKAVCKNSKCRYEQSIIDRIIDCLENDEFEIVSEITDEVLAPVWVEEFKNNKEDIMVIDEEDESKTFKVFKISNDEEKKIIVDILYLDSLALANLNSIKKLNEIRDAAIQLMMELNEHGLLDNPMKLAKLLINRGAFYRNIGQIIWCTEDYGIALEIMSKFINKEDINITKKYTDLLIERGSAFEQFEMLKEAYEEYNKAYDIRLNIAQKDESYIDKYLNACEDVVHILDIMDKHHKVIKYVEEMDFIIDGKTIIDEGEKSLIEINKIMIKAEEIERKRIARKKKREKGGFFSKLFNKKN